ncbi:MAG: hypothetical protein FWG17_08315 [Desulfovibrionaceae bacterium]|nr:hypothetical protein [Desulfovibrionaceae bacterium]
MILNKKLHRKPPLGVLRRVLDLKARRDGKLMGSLTMSMRLASGYPTPLTLRILDLKARRDGKLMGSPTMSMRLAGWYPTPFTLPDRVAH